MRPNFGFSVPQAERDEPRDAAVIGRREFRPEPGKIGRHRSDTESSMFGRAKAGEQFTRETDPLTNTIRSAHQKLHLEREIRSKVKQIRRGLKQDGPATPGGVQVGFAPANERDPLLGAISGILKRINLHRERLSASRAVEAESRGPGLAAKVTPPAPRNHHGRPASRQEPRESIIVDPRNLPPNETAAVNRKPLQIAVGAVLVVGAIATGIYSSDSLISAIGRLHLPKTLLSPFVGTPTAEAPPAAMTRLAGGGNFTHPVPSSYGVYIVTNGQLKRLEATHMRLPDTRIALGGLITKPSPVVVPDGRIFFIAYQRDLITNAPDSASVRVIAKVKRSLTFAVSGKPATTSVDDTWAVRAVSVELAVAPMAESQEMMMIRTTDTDAGLSPGRYMLMFKNQSYDFTVEGPITDTAQCLERTDTQDGTVYSECRELP